MKFGVTLAVMACGLAFTSAAVINIAKRADAVSNVDNEDEPEFWKRGGAVSNVDDEDEPEFWKRGGAVLNVDEDEPYFRKEK